MTSYKVHFTVSFEKCVKRLKKRFPNVNADINEAIHDLFKTPEEGDLIPNGEGIRKLRVRNTNLKKGKSGGYRLLYLVVDNPQPALYLLYLYAKSDQANVTRAELAQLLDDLPSDP